MASNSSYRIKLALITTIVVEVVLWAALIGVWYFIQKAEPSFRFYRSYFIAILIGSSILPVVFIFVLRWKNKALNSFAESRLMQYIVPNISTEFTLIRFLLFRAGIAMVIVGLSTPQYGIKEVESKVEGIDIIVAIDVSNSMDAEDLLPNRITQARMMIEQMVNRLKGDRVGIITFAGVADVHIPITNDYASVKSFLKSVKTDFPVQGTAIGEAIDLAMASFDMKNGSSKAIVVLSDGENHEGDAMIATKAAQEYGVKIFTVGIGSAEGGPIPQYEGDRQVGYKTNQNGETVITRLNQQMMEEIATGGDGAYFLASQDGSTVDKLLDALDEMEATELRTDSFMDYEDHFYIWLIIGAAFLFIEYIIPEKVVS